MFIRRKSPLSGESNQMDLQLNPSDVLSIEQGWGIMRVAPQLTAEQRIFYATGLTLEEQKTPAGIEYINKVFKKGV